MYIYIYIYTYIVPPRVGCPSASPPWRRGKHSPTESIQIHAVAQLTQVRKLRQAYRHCFGGFATGRLTFAD